jgi:3'(2'), 5'-bisphosphate nucleotidase
LSSPGLIFSRGKSFSGWANNDRRLIKSLYKLNLQPLIYQAFAAALEASQQILRYYKASAGVDIKSDGTPVTEADRSANKIILEHLGKTGLPVISEESSIAPWKERQRWEWAWIVDPLDGTREFIKENGEFTVNIALVHNGSPIAGVIIAPALDQAFIGLEPGNAWKINHVSNFIINFPAWNKMQLNEFASDAHEEPQVRALKVAASRSHLDPRTAELISRLTGNNAYYIYRGSSVKFCHMASKLIDIYPRYSTTYEWDTAAGHAILKAAGGEVYNLENQLPLKYNKQNLQNPPFLALADKTQKETYFKRIR